MSGLKYMPEEGFTTEGFDPDVMFVPFVGDGRVGFRVQKEGSTDVEFIYMTPSAAGDGKPDVFIYQGEANDPVEDLPQHFYTLFEEER